MPVQSQAVLSDLLLNEVLPAWSREALTLAAPAAAEVPVGTVLDASGAALTASTTANAAAVLIAPVHTGDLTAVTVRRGAVVARDRLLWPAGANDGQIATGLTTLAACGIVPRVRL